MEKQTFYFTGIVKYFDQIINTNYQACTRASSKEKAKNNICYRYKREHNLVANTKISLSGTIKILGGTYDRVRI